MASKPETHPYLPHSNFTAGFIQTSSNLFIFSVWFSKASQNAVIWSANPNSPVNGSASLVINSKFELLLNDIPFRNHASPASNSTRLTLSNNGNLVFGDWESFKNPTNTILPNQNLTGIELHSNNGRFKFVNSSTLILTSSSATYYGGSHSPVQNMDDYGKLTWANSAFLTSDYGDYRFRKLVLDDDGNLRVYSFNPEKQQNDQWTVVWMAVREICQIKGTCGDNAICVPEDGSKNGTQCVCPSGFKQFQFGTVRERGCERKIELSNITKFIRLDYVNYTSQSNQRYQATNLSACESKCSGNPRCLAFSFKFDGTGSCVTVMDNLLYGYWSPSTKSALYLKVDKSESEMSNFTGMTELLQTICPVNISLPFPPKDSNIKTRNIVIIICTLFAAEFISGVAFFWSFVKRYIKYRDMATSLGLELLHAGGPKRFTYNEVKAATNDFSHLIGRGGFGDVYRGELPDRRVVAVKCLKSVTGGDTEFWAEVTIIAKMHHLNLVRLWGFCAEKGQRMLVYEYISGGSLDKFLFRPPKAGSITGDDVEEERVVNSDSNPDLNVQEKPFLDWNVRYRIALGVARAIVYLHEECMEWVLHCDIKPENILLGEDFCPKISDFGLAKLRKKEDMVTMSRMRGTPGYMAPEWIRPEPITSKADVYSFGMVLLELVTGVRSFEKRKSVLRSEEWYFPGWAFDKVFEEKKMEDILDRQIRHCYNGRAHSDMVNRMVQTAMWCLQEQPEMRPTMGKVAKMLEGTVDIIEPKRPNMFFLGGGERNFQVS